MIHVYAELSNIALRLLEQQYAGTFAIFLHIKWGLKLYKPFNTNFL